MLEKLCTLNNGVDEPGPGDNVEREEPVEDFLAHSLF